MSFGFGKTSTSSSASNQQTTTTTNTQQTDNRTVLGDNGFQVQAGAGSTLSFVLPKPPGRSKDSNAAHDQLAALAANSAAAHPAAPTVVLAGGAGGGNVAGAAGVKGKLPWWGWAGIAVGVLAAIGIGAKALGGKRG